MSNMLMPKNFIGDEMFSVGEALLKSKTSSVYSL